MKFALAVAAFAFFNLSAGSLEAQMDHMAHMSRPAQQFQTSAGPVKITPIYHASLLSEAGNKTIYLDPAKPAEESKTPTPAPEAKDVPKTETKDTPKPVEPK